MVPPFSSLSPSLQQAVLNGPALRPPPGVDSNFDDPPNMNSGAYGVISLSLFVATLAISVRLYAKTFLVKQLGIEYCKLCSWVKSHDISSGLTILVLSIAAYGLFVGLIYCLYRMTGNVGMFVHQWDIRFRGLSELLYDIHLMASIYSSYLICVKSAILIEWIHVFVPWGARNAFSWACHILLWFNVLFYAAVIIEANLVCFPWPLIWDKTLDGYCIASKPVEVISAAINVVSDIVILLLPQRIIWTLKVSTKRKIGISIIFAIGILAVASSAGRLYSATEYFQSDDATYVSSSLVLWSLAEITCLLLVLCIPSVPRVWKESRLVPSIAPSFRSWVRLSRRSLSSNQHDPEGQIAKVIKSDQSHRITQDGIPIDSITHSNSPTETDR